jgi:hypothetical protein
MSKNNLLRDFDKTAHLVRPFVADRYGEDGADALYRGARRHCGEIIPRIPRTAGIRARMLNNFLRITAQEIALYKAVRERGGTAPEAWEICHEAIRLRMKEFPKWKRWLFKQLMYSRLMKRAVARREERKVQLEIGNFEVRYLAGDGSELGAAEFAPYVCMSDIALSDALGWGLIRTQTLADGCSHCDFRFKRDAETRITSRTPEVQETIERIERQSAST